jgi:hypothetical protein
VDGPAAIIGPPAAAGGVARLRARKQRPRDEARCDDAADLLPPVRYPATAAEPSVNVAGQAAPAAARRQAGTEAQAGLRRLLALLTMAIAVFVSVLLPVAGTVVATAVIVLLRAADRAHGALARRRSARGARLSDVPVMVATAPWALARALFSTVLLAPLALACGAAAAAAAIIAVRANPYPAAGAYAAGAFVAFYGFGLGSGKPRRQLGQLFGAVARRSFPAALAAVLLTALAAGAADVAVTQPHHLWPLSASFSWHIHGLRHLADQVAFRLHHL